MGAREEGTQVLGHPLYAHRAAEKLPPACQPPAMSSDQEKKQKKTNTSHKHKAAHLHKPVWELQHTSQEQLRGGL